MATTYVDYTATAAQTDFAFTFEFLEEEHVTVEIDGSPISSSLFSVVTSPTKKIVLNSGATAGQKVRVRRKSQPDTDLVDFENGSVLTESELDRAYLHNRYLNEEISELNDASLQKAVGSDDWDATNQKLTNLADPTEAQDAATKNYVDTQDALQVTKTGDSMSGALAMGSNKITGLGTPTLTDDAATKTYVDAKVSQVSSSATSPPTKWVFTGTAGANTTYSVTGAEVNGDTAYDVSIDGAVQEPTTDFTVDPDTDTLTIIPTLSGGEDIVVIERGFGIPVSDGVVGEDQLQTNSVSTAKIQNDAVDNSKIADDAVDTAQLADDAVDGTKIADDSIDSEHYVDESIDTDHLADHSVTAVKISNTDPIFNVQTGGNVGIGTNSPAVPLDVRGDVRLDSSGGTDRSIYFRNQDPASTVGGSIKSDYYLSLWAGNGGGIPIQIVTIADSGNVGINTVNPSAPLEVASTTGGVIIPRMTTSQRTAVSASDGEMVYDTDLHKFYGRANGSWVALN